MEAATLAAAGVCQGYVDWFQATLFMNGFTTLCNCV
jgi:hypothetical protein